MTVHVADELIEAMQRRRAPVCVGLDPVWERLPAELRTDAAAREPLAAIEAFSRGVIEVVGPHVPCVKIQSACFERYGWQGVRLCSRIIAAARSLGLLVVLDAKRGDIGISAAHYAAAVFEGDEPASRADWLTINAYLGADGIEPFLQAGRGAFALVRTSNPGGDAIQSAALSTGGTVAQLVAVEVARIGADTVGTHGYSALGAVVGATKPNEIRALRRIMPQQIFLVPGYGAQGGSIADVLPCFDADGRGAIITASRSVIYAPPTSGESWTDAIGRAAAAFADELGTAVGWR